MAKKPPDHLHVVEDGDHAKAALADDVIGSDHIAPVVFPKFPEAMGRKPEDILYDGVPAGEWKERWPELALPPDCPVLALGHGDDGMFFFLNSAQQFVALQAKDFGQKSINALFLAAPEFLYWAWPRVNASGVVVSWRQEKVTEDLMHACWGEGVINPLDLIRGRGAWRTSLGSLIVHCGGELWESGRVIQLGKVDQMIYPRRPAILRPWPDTLEGKSGPALELVPLLRLWNFSREIDHVLLLGWMALSMIAGAIDWRPMVYLAGDRATGKSTLQKLIKLLLGPSLVQSANTTAAGIYQLMKWDALPCAIDENEADPENKRARALLELARQASDDQLTLRGGDRHQGVQFYNRSSFLFSSINPPPLESADYSRMGYLQLKPLKPDAVAPLLIPRDLAILGRKCLRRMIDAYPRLEATRAAYCEMLHGCGHEGRGQQTFGMFMAGADLLVGEDGEALGLNLGTVATDLRSWERHFQVTEMRETEDPGENWRQCLDRLLTAHVDVWRHGQRKSVSSMLHALYNEDILFELCRDQMVDTGLTLLRRDSSCNEVQLAIPMQNAALEKLFYHTKWQGAAGNGLWGNALRQAPEDHFQIKKARIGGWVGRCICMPLSIVMRREQSEK